MLSPSETRHSCIRRRGPGGAHHHGVTRGALSVTLTRVGSFRLLMTPNQEIVAVNFLRQCLNGYRSSAGEPFTPMHFAASLDSFVSSITLPGVVWTLLALVCAALCAKKFGKEGQQKTREAAPAAEGIQRTILIITGPPGAGRSSMVYPPASIGVFEEFRCNYRPPSSRASLACLC